MLPQVSNAHPSSGHHLPLIDRIHPPDRATDHYFYNIWRFQKDKKREQISQSYLIRKEDKENEKRYQQ